MQYATAKKITIISHAGDVYIASKVVALQKSQLIELILKQAQETGLPTHAAVTWPDEEISFVHADSDNVDVNGICWDDYL